MLPRAALRATTPLLTAALALLAVAGMPSSASAGGGGIRSVSAGAYHSCAVLGDSSVACWGRDDDGQVGFGSTATSRNPTRVKSGGGYLTSIRAVSAGKNHSCALKTDGTVWCWGSAEYGQVGDGTTGDGNSDRLEPAQVRKGTGYLTGITAISAGGYHTCARRSDGTAWCWGDAAYGAVGDGTTGDATTHLRLKAVKVRQGGGSLAGVTRISAGWAHSCARRSDGTAWCWGYAEKGAVGDGTTGNASQVRLKAVQVRRGSGYLTNVKDIEAGEDHSCAIRADGTAWCWGHADKGQVGDGTTGDASDHVRLKAVQVRRGSGYLTGVTGISAGQDHSCARRGDGLAYCWGHAFIGQVGDGTTGDASQLRLKAVRVLTESGALVDVRAVTAGGLHSCARLADTTAWCWGGNEYRQLGIFSADSNPHAYAVKFGEGTIPFSE